MQIDKTDLDKYKSWLESLKEKFQSSQIKASIQVNSTLLEYYWNLAGEIIEKEKSHKWGTGFLKQLSSDLMKEFPDVKGFSYRNIRYIKQWYLFWQQAVANLESEIWQQLVARLFLIPWGHNLVIISKSKSIDEAIYYVNNTIKNGISRTVLVHQMETNLYSREAKALTNFSQTLPDMQSDLAREVTKDPYVFDFLTLSKDYQERELKTVDFKPEFAGKLNFYISAVDGELKSKEDNPTIGILICKSKNDTVVEYSLKDINKPMGVSEYELTHVLPENLKSSLPTIEEIEAELEMLDE
ncbi:PDDEXK nuclease domain-containing protein [Arcobacter roscoffensis]|uniref:PDDEXK nuclease domain-containing protein n=1 Tax=Arcobacter roscoffensis TaxID=2961520 RepID=A0ABY5E6L5_9BACT|nr:PDDEXK nuclease domain-containing protein [Arcobacter roscoffensis]UTJ07787.1 PDDEXK nuclease domain-containing protein [Arcobacter roscoffensis]